MTTGPRGETRKTEKGEERREKREGRREKGRIRLLPRAIVAMICINRHQTGIMAKRNPDKANRAKVFWTGRSQAIRLPKAYRFDGDEVTIRRDGDAVILEPLAKRRWPPGYWESFGPVGEDFRAPEPLPPSPHRDDALDKL
jgi:antitoxin VapB